MTALRVLLVDDHPLVLSGLSAILAGEPGVAVAATARDAASAMALVKPGAFDVAVVDLRLPDVDGAQLCRRLLLADPRLRVVVLTMHAGENLVRSALAAGASGYVLKDADPDEVVDTIRQVARGNLVLGARARPAVADSLGERRPVAVEALTGRERQILDLLARGLPTATIAERLGLAPKTVRNRLTDVFAKIGVADRAAAVAVARDAGLGIGPRPDGTAPTSQTGTRSPTLGPSRGKGEPRLHDMR